MGYHSDVAYTIRAEHDNDKKAVHTFFTFLAEAKSKPECKIAMDEVDVDEKEMTITFYTYGKWYESDPSVCSHEALWELAKEYDNMENTTSALAGAFVRMGEDTDDIRQDFFGNFDYDWVRVERKLHMDWTDKKPE